MSRVVEAALKDVQKSEFIFNERGGFEVRNAVIFWTNFAGIPDKYENKTRNFNLAVTPEMGKELIRRGWKVKERDHLDGDDAVIDKLFFINIKVNMNSTTPPLMKMFSEFKGKKTSTPLDITTVGELDRIDMQSWDIVVNAYNSPQFPGKVTGYLQKLNAIQSPNIEFGGKYDDWMDPEYDCLSDGTCSLTEHM